jgi:hypothetical protein
MRSCELLQFRIAAMSVGKKLKLLAKGDWNDHLVRPTKHTTVKLFRTNFSEGGRIIWEQSIAYSDRMKSYADCIRVWAILADHDPASGQGRGDAAKLHDGEKIFFKGGLETAPPLLDELDPLDVGLDDGDPALQRVDLTFECSFSFIWLKR